MLILSWNQFLEQHLYEISNTLVAPIWDFSQHCCCLYKCIDSLHHFYPFNVGLLWVINSKVRFAEEAVVGEGQQFEGITIHMLAEEVAVVPMILTYDGWHLSGFRTLRNFCGWPGDNFFCRIAMSTSPKYTCHFDLSSKNYGSKIDGNPALVWSSMGLWSVSI